MTASWSGIYFLPALAGFHFKTLFLLSLANVGVNVIMSAIGVFGLGGLI